MNREERRKLEKFAKVAREIRATKPKIMLTFAHPGTVHTDFMSSVLQVVYSGKYDLQVVEGYSGPVISKARNSLAEHFLSVPGAEYLLMVDTDMVFNDEVLDRLLKADLPIVSALYVAPYPHPDELNPVALVKHEDDGKYWPLELDTQSDGFDPEQPVLVDGVGMGLCLIKRAVVEDVGVDVVRGWPYAETEVGGYICGEDLTFCIRARENGGHSSYVIPAARAGHRKTFTV